MAAANFCTVALFKNIRRNHVVMSSSSTSGSFPSSFGRRRNHLRPKILKTLIKPYPTPSNPTPSLPPPPSPSPLEPLESPHRSEDIARTLDVDVRIEDEVVMEEDGRSGVECEVDVLRSEIGSEMVAVDRFSGKLDMKVVGMYGLGLFVLQAVCAVLIFGSVRGSRDGEDEELSSGSNENIEKQRVVLMEDDVRIRRIVAKASEVVNVDESVLEERIGEIRAMARNAREREAKSRSGKSDVEGLGEDGDEMDGIEKEVSGRLVKLQKMLGSVREKSSVPMVNNLSKAQKGSGSPEKINEKLIFPKKQTFINSVLTNPMNDPKGFSAVTDHKKNPVDELEANKNPLNSTDLTSPTPSDGNSINGASTLKENVDKKLLRKKALDLKRRRANKKTESPEIEPKAGGVQGIGSEKLVGTSNTSTAMGASELEVVEHDKNGAMSLNSSSQNRESKKSLEQTVKDEGSVDVVASWWLRLPYVFAILMRQGSGPGGLYTLKASAKAREKQDEAYTVAFEDRGDANNFCYIVESFFEDMTDFTADIVPLPTKEMREPVRSGVLNVIIVRKGQLELYAGQPLGEAETRLRSLVL